MIQYLLECIAFQLLFLLIYDLFLKKETFFNWNRFYLLATFVLSLILPWVKLEILKTNIPQQYVVNPIAIWQLNNITLSPQAKSNSFLDIPLVYVILITGMLLTLSLFLYKIVQIHRLKRKGEIHHFSDFTRILIKNSDMAFSFFKNIFLGEHIPKEKEVNILAHELVHIKQFHSLDLLFFELMRILLWFNPLVYIYQKRVSELHEFIADATVAKSNKKQQYQLLLSEVFQTQNISFVNQFFTSSLIKKRIVMLQKQKSKNILKLKYALVFPLLSIMLVYTSCETELDTNEQEIPLLLEDVSTSTFVYEIEENGNTVIADFKIDKNGNAIFTNRKTVPFAVVDEAPIFPGCVDASDTKACFNEKIQEHIRKNFRYPLEAQELGIQGKVIVVFTIAKDGTITNLRLRGPDKALEDEARRIISKLPQMQPGRQKGEIVPVPFSIPITFKLQ